MIICIIKITLHINKLMNTVHCNTDIERTIQSLKIIIIATVTQFASISNAFLYRCHSLFVTEGGGGALTKRSPPPLYEFKQFPICPQSYYNTNSNIIALFHCHYIQANTNKNKSIIYLILLQSQLINTKIKIDFF